MSKMSPDFQTYLEVCPDSGGENDEALQGGGKHAEILLIQCRRHLHRGLDDPLSLGNQSRFGSGLGHDQEGVQVVQMTRESLVSGIGVAEPVILEEFKKVFGAKNLVHKKGTFEVVIFLHT